MVNGHVQNLLTYFQECLKNPKLPPWVVHLLYSLWINYRYLFPNFFMLYVPCILLWALSQNQQMHKFINTYKMYLQPLHMFRQVNCHPQGASIKELQVLIAFKYTIVGFTAQIFTPLTMLKYIYLYISALWERKYCKTNYCIFECNKYL